MALIIIPSRKTKASSQNRKSIRNLDGTAMAGQAIIGLFQHTRRVSRLRSLLYLITRALADNQVYGLAPLYSLARFGVLGYYGARRLIGYFIGQARL